MHTPHLFMPFVARRHPDADAIQVHASRWAAHFDLDHRNDREHFGHFMAVVYPDAAPVALQWITDFTVWLFVLDDLCDEGPLGADLRALAQVHTDLVAALADLPVARDGALLRAAQNLAVRLTRLQPNAAWRRRFLGHFMDYCAGNRWEARNRRDGRIPPLAEYLMQRRHTSSVFVYLAFIELGHAIALTSTDLAQVQCLQDLTNDVVSWGNDIASLRKEVAAGDYHNLVLLLERERGLDQAQALAAAAAMHNRAVAEFVALRARLAPVGDLATYADGMEHWMAANARWGAATARYNE